jgi:hypothetical protein
MATTDYPKDGTSKTSMGANEEDQKEDSSRPSKFFGSKKLGRAFDGLRGSNFGGAVSPNRLKEQTQPAQAGSTPGSQQSGSTMSAPPSSQAHSSQAHRHDVPIPPEMDATSHANMERMLEQTVKQSSRVDASGVRSPEMEMSIPEGLGRGGSCEVIPEMNLKPFTSTNEKGETHNGIKIFSARKHPSSEDFLREHFDAVESFAVVLERLCGVYGLGLTSIAIFHDPTGGTIAFNSNKALHFNVRFFYALQYVNNKHQSGACYSYWFVTFAHELAHHMAAGHNQEHGFYTESYMSLYIPKFIPVLAQIES